MLVKKKENIKKAIEKKYQDALRKAGINEKDHRSNVAKPVTHTNTYEDEEWLKS